MFWRHFIELAFFYVAKCLPVYVQHSYHTTLRFFFSPVVECALSVYFQLEVYYFYRLKLEFWSGVLTVPACVNLQPVQVPDRLRRSNKFFFS